MFSVTSVTLPGIEPCVPHSKDGHLSPGRSGGWLAYSRACTHLVVHLGQVFLQVTPDLPSPCCASQKGVSAGHT